MRAHDISSSNAEALFCLPHAGQQGGQYSQQYRTVQAVCQHHIVRQNMGLHNTYYNSSVNNNTDIVTYRHVQQTEYPGFSSALQWTFGVQVAYSVIGEYSVVCSHY